MVLHFLDAILVYGEFQWFIWVRIWVQKVLKLEFQLGHVFKRPTVVDLKLVWLASNIVCNVFEQVLDFQDSEGFYVKVFPSAKIYFWKTPVASRFRVIRLIEFGLNFLSFEHITKVLILRCRHWLLVAWIRAVYHVDKCIFCELPTVLTRSSLLTLKEWEKSLLFCVKIYVRPKLLIQIFPHMMLWKTNHTSHFTWSGYYSAEACAVIFFHKGLVKFLKSKDVALIRRKKLDVVL